MNLPLGYELKVMETSEFRPLWRQGIQDVFDTTTVWVDIEGALSEAEKAAQKDLHALLSGRYELNLGLFYGGKLIGWSRGYQTSMSEFFMVNSAVYESHRRKGLYSFLLSEIIRRVSEKGFQTIRSSHASTNNAVIIPKLKRGFVIMGLEVHEEYGVLARLVYHFNPMRREAMDFHSGLKRPSKDLKTLIRGI